LPNFKISNLKHKREIKIGAFVIVTLALFIWGISFLKSKDFFMKKRVFYAVYEKVDGLVKANPVFVKGLKVGIVEDVYFVYKPSTHIVVKLNLTSDIPIPKNSISRIYSYDLMGSKAIELLLGDSFVQAQNGDTLKSETGSSLQEEVNRQVQPIKKKAEDLLLSIDSVVTVVSSILNSDTRANLSQSFESIKITLKNLEHTTYNIDTLVGTQRYRLAGIVSNIESISYNIRQSNDKISNIINNFSQISDTLARANVYQTLANANMAITQLSAVFQKINAGEGSLGLLVNDNKLYNRIDGAARQLDELLEDVKLNPGRYVSISVFGKSASKNKYVAPAKKTGTLADTLKRK